MKRIAAMLLLASGMVAANVLPSAADSMQSSSMMTAMPKCAAGDPVVGMNMMTKMYMTHDQMKTKMAGMTQSQMQAAMTKNHVKMMCQSQAKAMGGKMMTKPM
jgi:hypothetical protein